MLKVALNHITLSLKTAIFSNFENFIILKILKSYDNFDFFVVDFFENFRVFVNRRWSLSVPNKYKTFIQSACGTKNPRKRLTLPVHSLKTMDRSIVKQLEKEKNSNFNVENFVVMFIYWGTMICDSLHFA